MKDRIRFLLNRLRERLWVKPLAVCLLSILAAFIASVVDHPQFSPYVPDITQASLKDLLTIISTSMLVIATFSVASMVSAYATAGSVATPRSFSLIVADDVSQNALSTFIGAFIFSIVALVALTNGYYGKPGRFALFLITILVFAIVIFTFLRWVDRIARLGRLGTTADKIEEAAATALRRRKRAPRMGGAPMPESPGEGEALYSRKVGYVQRLDMSALQAAAENGDVHIEVAALPGTFAAPGRALAYVRPGNNPDKPVNVERVRAAFVIGGDRTFDDDPRFGLVALSEIASRALSPAVNDPGTAIDIIGTFVRLFTAWAAEPENTEPPAVPYDRVCVPELSLDDLFDDAFNAISRDGAGMLEVATRLQKAFESLAATGNPDTVKVATEHARRALTHSEEVLKHPYEIETLRLAAELCNDK
jgi:uncharacterized membrane protein